MLPPCCRNPSSSLANQDSELHRVITGNCAFTTEGLGVTPGNQFSLIQCSEKPEESAILGSWFANLWNTLPASDEQKGRIPLDTSGRLQSRKPRLSSTT